MGMAWNYHRPELEKSIIKLCWQKKAPIGILGIYDIEYGWDPNFKTGIIKNKYSFAVSIKGYWIGFSR